MKRLFIVIAALFVAVVVGGHLLRKHEEQALLARAEAAESFAPASPPMAAGIAPASAVSPSGQVAARTWDEFDVRWQAALETKRSRVPRADAAASAQVAAAMERVHAALRQVHLTEIAAGKRSRHFMADTETLLAATRPQPGDSSAEAEGAAAELQVVLGRLADPARPDLGLAQGAADLLFGEGPPQRPSGEPPYPSDLGRFAEDVKRVLIYTSMPVADVLRATDELHALLQSRLERALAYDEQLVRAIELARVASRGRGSSAAKRALAARLYEPLQDVIQLVALDIDDLVAHGTRDTGTPLTRAEAYSRVEEGWGWGWQDSALSGWLLATTTGSLRQEFLAFRAAERRASSEPPPLPKHLQEVFEGVQKDREAAGLEPRKRRSPARGIEEQFKQLAERPNPFAAAPSGRQQRN